MLSYGFKEQIYNIFKALPSKIQVALFSWTMSDETLEMAENFMKDPVKVLVKQEPELTLEGIKQFYINCVKREWKLDALVDLYDTLSIGQSVIFCNTRRTVMWLADELRAHEYTVSAFHGDLEPEQRRAIFNEFRTGSSRILITTNILTSAIEYHGVSLVIHYNLPHQKEFYLRRIGWCGSGYRRKVVSISLVTREDFVNMRGIEQYFQTKIEEMTSFTAQCSYCEDGTN